MTKSKKEVVLTFSIITIFFTSMFQTSCNSVSEEYTTRLDTLDQKLKINAELLSIDFATIETREKAIIKELRYMRKYYDQTYSQELGNNLTKYKGIRKAYSNFIKNYPIVFNEMKALEKQAVDLRISVNNNDIDKPAFKQYYQTELTDVNNNLAFSERITQSIHALEPEYQRISDSVRNVLRELADSNPEFRQEIERDSAVNKQ